MRPHRIEQLSEVFLAYCREKLDFNIEDFKYYSCLPLCALDAVFSIGVRYVGVSRTVDRFCRAFGLPRTASNPTKIPSRAKQITVHDFLTTLNDYTPEELAHKISNRQRTSSKNGILKTAAFLQWLDILELYRIQTYQDFHKKWNDTYLERDLRAVRGQGSGISTDYFYMLAGNTGDVKVDRHILSFTCSATGEEKLSSTMVKSLFQIAVKELQSDHPNLTVRHLDHIVWEYQQKLSK